MFLDNTDYLIELRGVYDGWSIAVLKDGSYVNRWAGVDGYAEPGYERRWLATQQHISLLEAERERAEQASQQAS